MTNVFKNFLEEPELKKFKEFFIIIFVAFSIGSILTVIKTFLNLDGKTTKLVALTILLDEFIVFTSICLVFVKWFIIFYLKQVEEVCSITTQITKKETIRRIGNIILFIFLFIFLFFYIKNSIEISIWN